MDSPAWYRLAADGMLITHVSIVVFIVLGLVLTLVGGGLGWLWVRNRWYRGVHLLCIAVVVGQSWLGIVCPLTSWETWLREAAGQKAYNETFIAYWLRRLLYFEADPWVFVVAYSAFGLLVLLSFYWVPVRWRGRGRGRAKGRE